MKTNPDWTVIIDHNEYQVWGVHHKAESGFDHDSIPEPERIEFYQVHQIFYDEESKSTYVEIEGNFDIEQEIINQIL